MVKNVYAFDSNNYKNRNLCGGFEVAGFHADGVIDKVECFDTYEKARTFMKNNGAIDLAIMAKVNGQTKIIDANVALLDLSVNPETLTYFYTNPNLTGSSYTYMDTGSLYGGVDGVHLDTAYSSTANVWTAKVRIGNFTGWIRQSAYEIVPITWVKSSSSYTVTANDIRHNYVSKIQETYSGSKGSTIGPKPTMLNVGTYYSYDGHYFYKDRTTMIKDYKNGNYNNAVNKNNVYYNYYMYLSNHTRTNYSSINIDEYIRNNLGYKKNVYGNSASSGTSRLYGMGNFFYYAQEKYGVNAILSLSLSRNETGNGTSNLAINKNNGFGLNAVDSNPTQAADWYATFSSSILGYASKWITYGYAHPRDWRYFGPQFGDKWIGMNVKYASDTYWSEKMAANYYALDRAFGLQDYNYYQLGVVNGPTIAYKDPNTSSKQIYTYPEKEDAVVIVGEVTKNNEKWYQVVSDLNINSNYNEITSGNYNWNATVYVKASGVTKINTGKNGYISPNRVFEYQNKNYEYNLYIENTELKPKVAITTKNTPYYYDSALTSKTGTTLLKDRYVMVYAVAYQNSIPVSYLVTSDYWYDQKEWISADSIQFKDLSYGKVSVTVSGNQYTWVNSNTQDIKDTLISGLYTNSYVPVLESLKVGNNTWYKVPVNLTSNNNIYGYTLAAAPGVSITLSKSVIQNTPPVITASDKVLNIGDAFDPKTGVTASDAEDGNITSKLQVTENTVNTGKAGEYKVTYKVTDSKNLTTTKTIKVTVKGNQVPVITASDKTLTVGDSFNPKQGVTAKDAEDGDLTSKIQVTTNTVNTAKVGTYKVVYTVTDNNKQTATKEIKVIVQPKSEPVTIEGKTIEELLNTQKEGGFYLDNLVWDANQKKFVISGYLIILNQNNTNKEYSLLAVDKNTKKIYISKIAAWKQNTPYDLGSSNGNNYSDSWFKGTIDYSNIPNGDYDLYMLANSNAGFTISQVTNLFNKKISRRGNDALHGYEYKVQQKLKQKQIELSVREELYTTEEPPTERNMINGYAEIKFKNNKLYILGYSYDYNGIYNNPKEINRKIILENTSNYQQHVFDVTTRQGPSLIQTVDGKDKTYAWYEGELDISSLDKGTYALLIYTKTSNSTNYDDIKDVLRMLNVEATMNGKNYKVTYNMTRQNRIEFIIK